MSGILGEVAIPYLEKFLSNYWMETADLVFGDLEGAATAFVKYEGKKSSAGLLSDLNNVSNKRLFYDDSESIELTEYWNALSARNLSRKEGLLVERLLKEKLFN